ncbi:MAG: sigma-70 family RNA polymerase sigma factor [Pirellulaceae bacterium]
MWPEHENTQELLMGVQEGDDEAVNQLFDRHRAAVRRLVQMRLDQRIRQRVDVSDVVQEVLISANRRLKEYLKSPPMPFHLWIRQITKDRIIDAHRRHRVSAKRSVDRERALVVPAGMNRSTMELAAHLCDGELTPAALATQREMVRRVTEVLSQLNEQESEIIMMRHFEHLSNQEVAQALELSEPAAGMRYLRALRKLRALLLDNPEEESEKP